MGSVSQPGEAKHDPFGEIRGAMTIETKGSQSGEAGKVIEAEVLMTATGRVANTKGLGLEEAGVTLNRGTIEVNGDLETTVPGVYAVGDVVGRPSLASTGIDQGLTAVKRMFEQDETVEGTWMQVDPNAGKDPASLTNNPLQYAIAIWTIPELSFIGYTKESAEKAGFKNVAEGVAYYPNTIRGRVQGLDIGLLKIVFQKPSGRILGVHILGEDACELISYGTALAQSSKTVRQVLGTTFAAVTYHELYTQAATHACAQLDEDSWAEILEGMGFDDGCFVADCVAQGLVEAGMNERSAKEIEVKLTERSCTTADGALEIIKQYRIPGKYRMAQALKEQFKDAGDDAQFRASAEKMFKSMDVDGGGSINKEEMIAGLAKRGLTLSAAVADDLMRAVDADGSGEVDFDEFFIVLKELVGKD